MSRDCPHDGDDGLSSVQEDDEDAGSDIKETSTETEKLMIKVELSLETAVEETTNCANTLIAGSDLNSKIIPLPDKSTQCIQSPLSDEHDKHKRRTSPCSVDDCIADTDTSGSAVLMSCRNADQEPKLASNRIGISDLVIGNTDDAVTQSVWSDDGCKWICGVCSNLNYSNITSCLQCLTPKLIFKPDELVSAKCVKSDEEAIESNRNNVSRSVEEKFWNSGKSNVDQLLCDGTTNVEKCYSAAYNDYWIDPPVNGADEKWPCPLCTFENWPASAKCSMCYTARDVYYQSSNRQDSSNNNMDSIVENNRVLSESIANSSYAQRLRNRKMETDSRWLEACRGVVVGNIAPVEEYLASGGDPARQLTAGEVAILNRPSAFDVGYTLVHLALRYFCHHNYASVIERFNKLHLFYRFQHQETLAMLLSHLDCSNSASVVKRVPSYVAPDLDQDIRNYVMGTIRYGKGNFRCNFSSEIATFTLPSGKYLHYQLSCGANLAAQIVDLLVL